MTRSISLALYLATKARRDRAAAQSGADGPRTEEDRVREAERLGQYVTPRPEGPLIWFHTGRDNEAQAVRGFVQRLQAERDDVTVLLTTGADCRADSDPGAIWQFAPEESLPAIGAFLDHWKPDVAVWTEPDLRPALAIQAADSGIPLLLVDADTARPDAQARRWWRGVSSALLAPFAHVLTGSATAAAGLRRLGADPSVLRIMGFLDEGTAAPGCNERDRAALAKAIGARPVWLAARIGRGERAAVLQAYRQALRRAHRLLLILVPNDIGCGEDWARDLTEDGLSLALRSDGQEPDVETQVYIANTEQEMGLWYRLAPFSFLGQSLDPQAGGISPLEAAALGSAILHGPHVRHHQAAYARLAAVRATRAVQNAHSLGDGVEALLSPEVAAAMAHEAWQVVTAGAEVTDLAMDLILTALDKVETV